MSHIKKLIPINQSIWNNHKELIMKFINNHNNLIIPVM